jgi:hypothetical protein
VIEEMHSQFYLILVNFYLNIPMWLEATVLGSTFLEDFPLLMIVCEESAIYIPANSPL